MKETNSWICTFTVVARQLRSCEAFFCRGEGCLEGDKSDEGAEGGGEPEKGLVSIGNGGEGADEEKQESSAEPRGKSPKVMGETMVSEEDGEHGVGEALGLLLLYVAAGAAGT